MLAEHTELFLCFGGLPAKNAQVNAGGISRHPVAAALRGARAEAPGSCWSARCGTTSQATPNGSLPIRPGTDTALLLAMCWHLVETGLHDETFLRTALHRVRRTPAVPVRRDRRGTEESAVGGGRLRDPGAATIARLAEDAAAHRTMISLSWSLQRARHGEQPVWAGIALACVLGQIGLPGGGFGHGYGCRLREPAPVCCPTGCHPPHRGTTR